MTDREWRATRCVECYGTDRDAELYTACGCQQRACSATESARMGEAKTNGPGLAPETVLATPIRLDEQEDYPKW